MKPRMIYQVEETRLKIIAEARRMFLSDGLYQVQMQDLAKKTGISRASLYRYYGDKLDLALDVLASVWNEIEGDWTAREAAIFREGTNALERIALYIRKLWLSPRYGMQLLFMAEFDAFYSGVRIPDDFAERLGRIFAGKPIKTLERLIAEGIADGSVRKDTDPHLAGVTVLNAVRGLHQRISLRGKVLIETDKRDLSAMNGELARLLIAGLAAQ